MDESPSPLDYASDWNAWRHASAYQLLRLLKLLGVEQRSVAAFLGATVSSVSMWVNGVRSTPPKYRPQLLEYAQGALAKASAWHQKEIAALPEDLKQATILEWHARLARWSLEVLHDKDLIRQSIAEDHRRMEGYIAKKTPTVDDLDWIIGLSQSIASQARALKALKEAQDVPPAREEPHE
jgi:transcriptional regulator with XRE-family HTH domain